MDQKYRGVYRHKDGGWIAVLGKKYLGIRKTFDEAVTLRTDAEIAESGSVFVRHEIKVDGSLALIPLHGRKGKFHGWATIDAIDLPLIDQTAWTLDPRGYVVGRPSGHDNSITLHRVLMYGLNAKGGTTDHINGDKMDNRRGNLRKCSQAQNSRNTKLAKNNSSGAKGVQKLQDGRWKARITFNRKEIRLGVFGSRAEASAAYNAAALILHGDFASPNPVAIGEAVE
jgi:hypothetical protein